MDVFEWFAGFVEKIARWVCCESEMNNLCGSCENHDSSCNQISRVTKLDVVRMIVVTMFSFVLAIVTNELGKNENIRLGFLFFVMEMLYFFIRWGEHSRAHKDKSRVAVMKDKWYAVRLGRLLVFYVILFGIVDFLFISCVSTAAGVGFFDWYCGPDDVANMYSIFFLEVSGVIILTYLYCVSYVYYTVGKIYLKMTS